MKTTQTSDRDNDLSLTDASGWVVILLDDEPNVVHRCERLSEAAAWCDEWLVDDLGLMPIIVPAKSETLVVGQLQPRQTVSADRIVIYEVWLFPEKRVLARYFEQERATRFVEHYNLMDGAAVASVAVVDYVATPPVDRSPGSESFVIFEVLLLLPEEERVVKRFFSRRRAERFAAEYNRREGKTTAYALPRFAVYAESEVLA